jgi:hypothetical protein
LALEVAEGLSAFGYEVTIGTNLFSRGFEDYIRDIGVSIFDDCRAIDISSFDFIWSQHLVAPLCKNYSKLRSVETKFFTVHLSPYEPLERLGLACVPRYVAGVLANSLETKKYISEMFNYQFPIINFYNAAPRYFINDQNQSGERKHLKRIIFISNHIPNELTEALKLLNNHNCSVEIFGVGHNYRRIRPSDLSAFDAVLTIGKSVQYALLRRVPIYCYDRFGGPGWITPGNLQNALDFNFSGRCCNRRLTPNEIVNELVLGYESAQNGVDKIFDAQHEKFNLNRLLSGLINADPSPIEFPVAVPVDVSRSLAEVIRTNYRAARGFPEALYSTG